MAYWMRKHVSCVTCVRRSLQGADNECWNRVKITQQNVEESPPGFITKDITPVTDKNSQNTGILQVTTISPLKSLNAGITVGDKTDGIYTDFTNKEDLGTTGLNQELHSAKNDAQSSQTASSNNLRNIHDNRLIFSRSVYSFDIQEDVAPGTTVGLVRASAPNQEADDKVYAIQEDDGNGLFVINPATGNFTLTRPLDFESAKYYILTVKAANTDGQFSVIRAYFNVLDINDNPPVFDPDSYSINIMENVPIGTSILTLNVTDADEGLNAALTFKIISGDPNRQFTVDRNAVLRVQQPLDLERQSIYTLIVQATDQAQCGSTRFTSSAWITVKLNDVNDNAPEFRTASTVYLPEDTSIGTVIMTVKAVDLDSGLDGHVEYSLQQFTGNKFSINATSGELSVIGDLDRELVEWVTINVTASDKGQPSQSSSISITAIITDVNDNSPHFTQPIYTVTVDENIPRGSDLLAVSATDPDEDKNGQVRYTISSKDVYIDSVIGLISVSGNLDRERIPVCSFVVFALDGGSSPRSGTATVNVVLRDVNDFAPIIEPVKMTLHFLENIKAVPQIVYQVLGCDDDLGSNSKLTYEINRGNEDGKFSISANGGLSLLQSLDREIRGEYMLLVTATDAGVPPLTGTGTIIIIVDDLNDNTPLFDQSMYTVTISEDAPIGVTVLMVNAVDPDTGENGQISYSVEGGESPFSIDPISGEIITTSALDREAQTNYTLIVLANDRNDIQPLSSSASVFITIGDVNDEPPQFLNDPYVANVPAILNEGSIVYAVTAKDGDTGINADLRFSLSGPNANKFVIDPLRGVIFAQHVLKGPMDIIINVNVTDGGKDPKMDSTSVTVRFQNTTDFPQISVDNKVHVYPEDQVVNTVISKVSALGKEKGKVRPIFFYLAAGNFGDVFQINQLTGELIIKKALDFEIIKHYQLWIEARNSGSPPFSSYARIDVNVTDVNDNFPAFKQNVYRCEIYENVPASKVCNVSAADLDSALNGLLEYRITDGNVNDVFNINSSTGVIRTARMLDRERMALYTLTVEAKDKGSNYKTGTASVIISVLDKNDNAPRFSQIFLAHVVENAPVGFTIVQITTTDEDIGVNAISTYSISDQSASLPFGVNQSTGDLIVTRPLDRETTDWYILRVHANDSAWDVNTDVTIFVTDTNDNAPQFTEPFYSLTVPEPKEKERFILQVSATDPDLELNGKIFYFLQSPNEFFRINATTGEIFTKQFISFKNSDNTRTDQNKIKFTVIASDLGEQPILSETTVAVTIVARNDYSPVFLPHRQLTPVPMNLAFGTKVAKVIAVDEDLYSNGKVKYYSTGNNGSFLFDIEQDSGWIFVTNSLASSLNKVFTVSVTAIDEGEPPLFSNTTVNFVITEENRFTPQFSTLEVNFSIPEDQSSGSVIGNLTASDTDQGINGHIIYSIVAGNNGEHFTIGNTTGLLTLDRSLDFEMDSVYSLQIYGQDGGWISKTGSINVVIRVEDVNDNPPAFCYNVFCATVAENSPCGTTVLKVNATDNDSGIHAEINYAIEDGHMEVFFIDPQTGIIAVQEILNFELHQFYEITVRAFNTHDSNQFSLAKVYVNVTGVNEYIPQFDKKQYNFAVSENELKGTIVGRVTATDRDLGFDGVVNYLLIGKSKEKDFWIIDNTGEIVVSGNMKLHGGSYVLLRVLAKNAGRIRGFDVDEALINITILNDNDAPVFKSAVYQTHVREDALVDTSVIALKANDSDIILEWNQLVIEIKDGNKNNSFSINSRTGEIFVARSLDRETVPFYNMTIIAFDRGTTPAIGSTQLVIIIDDVNDNGPTLVSTEGYVMENQPPGTQIISLNATDLDLPPNQGPFTYQLADNNASSFVTLSPAGVLSTKKMIDRELVSELYLPVIVHDSGIPPMSLMSIFHVLVLDQNDNPPLPRNLYIQVNYYGKYFPGGKVGSVKPEDPDVSNIFNCSIVTNSTTSLTVVADSCELLSGKQLREEDFNLTVKANDNVHSTVSSSIHIKYKHFNNATIDNSVLLLITPSVKEFLDKKYIHLVKAIDDQLSKNITKLYIFGMVPMGNQTLLMTAIKSNNGQYLSRSTVIDFYTVHKEWLRTRIGITISAVGYDPCTTNPCHHDAVCTKQSGVSLDTVVLESSSVIFLSHVLMGPFICSCPNGYVGQLCELDIDECQAAPCSNQGTCLNYQGTFSCTCPEGFTGSLCETDINECQQNLCQNGATCMNMPGTFLCICSPGYTGKLCQNTINYCMMSPCLNHGTCVNLPNGYSCRCPFGTGGNECDVSSLGFEELSYMELPSLDPRNNMIYVEFATIKENSLLLYNYDHKEGAEFLALEIVNGKVEFSYNLGNGTVRLVTDQKVADGQFHKILATRMGKAGSLTVDNCTNNQPAQFCFVSTPGIGRERTLDLDKNSMVFGGVKSIDPILLRPDQVKTDDFIGCIKEVKLNSVPVKFAEALSSYNILTSCPRLERACQDKTCLNNGVCLDRWSFYLCQCPEGFTGLHCEKDISPDTALNLNGQSHLDYFIKESYKRGQLLKNHTRRKRNQKGDQDASIIEIQFRTRSSKGILLHIQGNTNYITVKIMDGRINYISDAGSTGHIEHHLPDISVSDGTWHTFKMESNDFVTRLILDKKHLKNITYPTHKLGGIEMSTFSLGRAPVSLSDNLNEPGFKGCIKVFKYNNQVMPFTGSNDLVKVQPSDVSVQVGCREPNACLSNPCPTGMKCIDLWLAYECLPVSCFPDPCKHGGTCFPSSDGSYHCVCKPNFTGSSCEFCTSTINDHSACQEGNIQFPQWCIAVIIPVILVVIPLLVVFFKCQYTTLKNKRTKMITSLQTGTENKAFDDHDDYVDDTKHCTHDDDDDKQPDILKAEKNYHITDETYINATAMVQKKKCYGHQEYDSEDYDIDKVSSIAPSDTDVIQHHRQFQINNDHYTNVILSRSMLDKSQPFIPTVNQRYIQSTAQITPSQRSALCKKQVPKSGLANQHCPHTCSSEWFPSSFLFTERKHLINDLYLTGYEAELSHHVHFDTNQLSRGGIDNLAFRGDDQSERLPDVSTLTSSTSPNSRIKRIVKRLPLGLSVEEVKKLNAPKIQKPVKNTAQGILLSQFSQKTSVQKKPPGFLPSTDTSSDSDSHSSFTCSEYNFERELSAYSHSSVHKYAQQDSERSITEDNRLNEREIILQGCEIGHTSNSCLMDTEIISDEGSDNNMLPCGHSPVSRTHNWDSLLNWGPNFETYVEIFKDLAELPSEPGTENQFYTTRGSDYEEFL
ncbi:protocadherin Fat 4-like [Heptranchias perlo]|uniref:protocadherin Fat 4-like n=1 Tax=Heptranchias perlo TaxID=212740 RepID=UPI00355A16D3